MKRSDPDTNVTHRRGALCSRCTLAGLEADLPGYVFIPFCNFGLRQSCGIPAVRSAAAAVRKQSGLVLPYKRVLRFCVERVKDFASHFFRISWRSSQVQLNTVSQAMQPSPGSQCFQDRGGGFF